MKFDDLRGKFPEARFILKEWGKRSAILVDKGSTPFKMMDDYLKGGEVMLADMDKDLTVNLGGLSQSERDSILGSVDAGKSHPQGFDVNSSSLGLWAELGVNITGPQGGKSLRHSIAYNNDQTRKRDEALRAHPLLTRPPTKQEMEQRQAQFEAAGVPTELRMRPYGIAIDNLPEGIQQVGSIVDDIYKSLKQRNDALAKGLMEKLGLKGDKLPEGLVKLSDLPESFRNSLERGFSDAWQVNGFGSQSEADSFLANASGVEVRTYFGLRFFNDPGDPANHRPALGGISIFTSNSGGIAP